MQCDVSLNRISDAEMQVPDVKRRGPMVNVGATSHIITDISKFNAFDSSFQAGLQCVETAPGATEWPSAEVTWRCGCLTAGNGVSEQH